MIDTSIIEVLRRKFTRLESELNERGRRRWAASEALELGHGGIKVVAQATGLGESGRFAVGVKNCVTSRRRRGLPASGFGMREGGANRSRPMILPWSPRWKRWWTRRHGAIRCRRCAGPVRVHANWPRRLRARDIRSAIPPWRSCWQTWTIAYRAHARR